MNFWNRVGRPRLTRKRLPALSKARPNGLFKPVLGKDRADAAGSELRIVLLPFVCRVEVARAVKGQAGLGSSSRCSAGKDRADAAGGELLNRVVVDVCRVEIARAVKGQAEWQSSSQAGLAKTEPTPPGVNFSIVLIKFAA